MPRYYLHLWNGEELIEDPDGSDLPDLNAALEEATGGARDILASMIRDGEPLDGQRIEITSEDGEMLAVVPFKQVFRVG